MSTISVKDLLQAGVHFGHQPKRWNPKMKPYIFGERNGIYIIDLQKTLKHFNESYAFLLKIASEGKKILFVGTKLQAQDVVLNVSTECGMFYVTHRWLGGMLTNFETIRKSVNRLLKLEESLSGKIALSKKEHLLMDKKRASMDKTLSGVKEMRELPGALVIVDPRRERIAVEEARKLDIPIVSLIDTNCDPDGIEYIIPGNDDSIRSITLVLSKLSEAIKEGLVLKKKIDDSKPKEKPSAPKGGKWQKRAKPKKFERGDRKPWEKSGGAPKAERKAVSKPEAAEKKSKQIPSSDSGNKEKLQTEPVSVPESKVVEKAPASGPAPVAEAEKK